jgi:hypothetical protein
MSHCERTCSDRAFEKPPGHGENSISRPIVDMASSCELQGVFCTPAGAEKPVITASGEMIFSNLFPDARVNSTARDTPVTDIRPGPSPIAGKFHTVGAQIIGPDGKAFVPEGINDSDAQGAVYSTVQIAEMAQQGANTLRVFVSADSLVVGSHAQQELQQQMAAADANKMAIILTYSPNPTGGANTTGQVLSGAELTKAEHTLSTLAKTYKDSSNVWLDTMNESGSWEKPVDPAWLTEQKALIGAIRSIGNKSIIVMDDSKLGQGATAGEDPKKGSGLTAYAKELEAAAGGNLVGDVHVYQTGPTATDTPHIKAALEAIQNAGMPALIGETGLWPSEAANNGMMASFAAANSLKTKAGVLVWPDASIHNRYVSSIMDKGSSETAPYANEVLRQWNLNRHV